MGIPGNAFSMFISWFQVRKTVRMMRAALGTHRNLLAKEPETPYAGITLGKWRKRITVFESLMNVVGSFAFTVISSIFVSKACTRFDNPISDTEFELKTLMLVLFTLTFVGGVICFFSLLNASYTILLLTRLLPFQKRWYPMLIYEDTKAKLCGIILL